MSLESEIIFNQTFTDVGEIELSNDEEITVRFDNGDHNNFTLNNSRVNEVENAGSLVDQAINLAIDYYGCEFTPTGDEDGVIAKYSAEITHQITRRQDDEEEIVYYAVALKNGEVFNDYRLYVNSDEEAIEEAEPWFNENCH